MMMAAPPSRNMPMNSRNTLMIIRMRYGLSVSAVMAPAIRVGICSEVRIQAKILAIPMISSRTAVVVPLSTKIRPRSLKDSSL